MTGMIEVFDGDGRVTDFADSVLRSFQCYPATKDADSREQFMYLSEYEKKRVLKGGPETPSTKLVSTLDAGLSKANGQQAVAGMVCIMFRVLQLKGRKATLYAATKLASANIIQSGKVDNDSRPFTRDYLENGEIKSESIRAASGRADIEKRFRAWGSVAHLHATDLLAHNYQTYDIEIERYDCSSAQHLRTILEFEKHVIDAFPNYFPDSWKVKNLAEFVEDVEPFDISDQYKEKFGISTLW